MADTEFQCSNCGRDMPPGLARCAICESADEIGVPVAKTRAAAQPLVTPPVSNVIPLRPAGDAPQVTAPPAETSVDEAPPAESPPPVSEVPATPIPPPAPAAPPLDAQVARFLSDLEMCRRADMKIITLLGFPTAGKTFFLNRFKYEILHNESSYGCTPGFVRNGTFIASTTYPSVHVFEFDDEFEKFAIVDIPGEYFREYLEQTGGTARPEVKAALDDIFNKSKGLVVLIPAEELAFSSDLYNDYIAADGLLPWLSDHYGTVLRAHDLPDLDVPQAVLDYLARFTSESIIDGKANPDIAEEDFYVLLARYLEQHSLADSEEFDRDLLDQAPFEARRTLAWLIRSLTDHCRADREIHTFISNIVGLPYTKTNSPPVYVALSKADRLETRVGEAKATVAPPEALAETEADPVSLPADTPISSRAAERQWADQARRLELGLMLTSKGVSQMARDKLQLQDRRMAAGQDQLMEKEVKALRPLANKFSSRKYGFVTAFEGLDKTRINYNLPQHGVYNVIEWIFESLDLHSRYDRDSKLYRFIMNLKGKAATKPISPPKKSK